MKSYKGQVLLVMMLVIVLSLLVFTGCEADDAVVDDNAVDPTETINWTSQSTWPSGWVPQQMADKMIDEIIETSGGRLEIESLPSGSVVDAFDVLEAVHTGTLDSAHVWMGYWIGPMPTAGLFASPAAGVNRHEARAWMLGDEGEELLQEMFDNHDYNIKAISCGGITPEIFWHSHVPIRNIDDLQGLDVRGVGDFGPILEMAGANVQAIDGGEVFSAYERRVVDAIEFGTPAIDYPVGYHEVGDYLVVPGIHQPTSMYVHLINQDSWDNLPQDLQNVVTNVSHGQWATGEAQYVSMDIEAWENFLEEEEKGNIEIIYFDPESQKEIAELARQFYEERSAENPFFERVYTSQEGFRERYQSLFEYQEMHLD